MATLTFSSFAGTASATTTAAPDADRDALVARERALTRALVRNDRAALNEIYADDFTCGVVGEGINLSLDPLRSRYAACTALGRRKASTKPDWIEQAENGQPRTAEVDDLEVSFNGDVAVVRSRQTYRGWFPYDGLKRRIARVTDTWVKKEGRWVIQKRLSEPERN